MSNYYLKAKNKETGDIVEFEAMDDYFGKHQYGYAPKGWKHITNIGAYTQNQFDKRFEVVCEYETMNTPGKQLKNLLHNEGAMLDVAKKATEDQRESMNTPDVEKLPIDVRTWLRDYWYSLQDVVPLPESKRVELEQYVSAAIEEARRERDKEIVKIIHNELRNAPLEIQITRGVIFANVINRITNHE